MSSSLPRPAVSAPGVPAGDPEHAHSGMLVGDRYELVALRGRGGIGEVWEAEQAPTGRPVAIKLLQPGWQTDQNVRKRFVREGRLASTLQHRHIVDILEAGETRDGQPFIAMELIGGPSLDVAMQAEGPLPWSRVKRILLQICGALDHAHDLKIVHRDIKPSNIMLDNEFGQPDRCKLVDFGIAKQSLVHVTTQHLTGEGQMLGSPGFMSPEQLKGRPTDLRGDIYGLGCTGFFLLTGKLPFEGASMPEVIHNALYHVPRSLELADVDQGLRREIEAVLHRAIRRDPDDRFDSVLDFVVALDQVGRSPFCTPFSLGGSDPEPAAPSDAPTVVDAVPTVVRPMEISADLRPASDVPTVANIAPTSEVRRPMVTTPRGVISTQSHSHVLAGRTTADRVSWEGPKGFVEIARLPDDIIVVHMSGAVGPTAAWLFEQQLGPLLTRHRPAHLFWHLSGLSSFPSEVRKASLRCLSEHRDCIESAHVLTGPSLVGMSVSLATVALGGKAHVYDDHLAWREALDAWVDGVYPLQEE
ncbi:MAG: serine/threonine-protein kinase [Myxococcota bacterium]